MPIMLICFMPLYMLFAFFPSIACPLVSYLCLCIYTHGARMHGVRARSPRRKQKGRRYKYIDMSQATMFSSFRGLASQMIPTDLGESFVLNDTISLIVKFNK